MRFARSPSLLVSLVVLLAAACRSGGRSAAPEAPPAPPAAAEAAVPPEAPGAPPENINAPFLDPDLDVSRWVERFESDDREIARHRDDILAALELRPGMDVADVGAGTGLFTLPFARTVAPGRVFAVEISRPMLEFVERRAREAGLENVVPVLATETDPRLEPSSVDLVFVCDTYHHFTKPAEELAALRRALRPGGRLVVVDFDKIPGKTPEFFLKHVRADKKTVRREIEAAGFRLVEEPRIEGLEISYVLIFEKA